MLPAMLAPDSASIPRVGDYIQVDSFRVDDQPDGMAHATIFDDSGVWWATKLAPAVMQQ